MKRNSTVTTGITVPVAKRRGHRNFRRRGAGGVPKIAWILTGHTDTPAPAGFLTEIGTPKAVATEREGAPAQRPTWERCYPEREMTGVPTIDGRPRNQADVRIAG